MTQDLESTCEALPQSLLHPPRGGDGVLKRPEPEANCTGAKRLFLIAHSNEESQEGYGTYLDTCNHDDRS